jgi:branched-chain amino acid transport system permease protein
MYWSPVILILLFLLTLPLFLRLDFVTLFTKIIIFALLAMSLDLIFGYSGLWSFGHGALFGVAAYTAGILIVKVGITSFWVAAPCGVGVAVITAALFGVFGLRSKEIYFMLITFAFGQLLYVAVYTNADYTGGSNGLANVPYPNLGLGLSLSSRSFYYFVLVAVSICALLLQRIVKSPFGCSLMGIRDNEVRAKVLGYNTWLRRFLALLLSGFFAGVAGVLYVYYRLGIAPSEMGIDTSGMVIMMVIIGGVGTLWGGAIGAVVILFLQYLISLYLPGRWPLIMGALFIAAVFFAGDGIFPHLTRLWQRVCRYDAGGGGPVQSTKAGGETYQSLVGLGKSIRRNKADKTSDAEPAPDVRSADG